MKIEFVEIEIFGFKSIEHIKLELDDYGTGLHFLRGRNDAEPRLGSNGSGKTSIWDALTWCLFGKTISGLRNPDIKPREGKRKKTDVIVSLLVDGKAIRVRRTANPNALTLGQHAVSQDEINAWLGMTIDVWSHAISFGQGQPLFFDLQPREQMSLLSEVLNLERWEKRAKAAGARAAELGVRAGEIVGELSATEAQIKQVDSQLSLSKRAAVEWEEGHSKGIEQAEAELDECRRMLKLAEDKEAKLEIDLDRFSLAEAEHSKDRDGWNDKHSEAQRQYDQAEMVVINARTAIKKLKASTTCPTCKRPWDAHTRKEQAAEIAKLSKVVDAGIPKSVIRTLKSADKALGEAAKKASKARKETLRVRDELDPMRETIAILKANHAKLSTTISERQDQVNPYSEQLAQGRKTLSKLKASVKELTKAKAVTSRQAERAKFWQSGFKDVRLFVIDEVLSELEIATNAALEDVGLIGWQVNYSVERETKSGSTATGLNVTILGPGMADPVKWASWSGGEGQRLRLVGALALSEVLLNHAGIECNLEVLDEPTRGIGGDGVRDLCEWLAARADALGKQTWLVDHLAREGMAFKSVTTVVKDAEQGSYISQ